MKEFFQPDPAVTGVKGLVFIGEKTIGMVRDQNTTDHPGFIDMLGGGTDPGDATPFATFAREVDEEAGLHISEGDITYARLYPSIKNPGTATYFVVARLAAGSEAGMQLGDEGTKLVLMTPEAFIADAKGWDFLQERAQAYLDSLK
ncbi:MAG TPA: NUDIX domain-containing protein [Candidatus Saccharimonadales bacterium]|jgi:8-oxo-dGTP diphosphatase|nr:NUDIX domain-containing protein [Candidatus Saccharimonadales bacterium]